MSLVADESSPQSTTFVAPHGDQLSVVAQRGGLVTSWRCHGPWGVREMLYFDAERFADPAKSVRGGIPVLFPICGSLAGSALPQHGFARDVPWQIAEIADGSGIRLSVTECSKTLALYPHRFRLEYELRLQPQALAIVMRVSNPAAAGADPLPFSFGLHPYFAVPELAVAHLTGLPETATDQVAGVATPSADLVARLPEGVDMLAGPGSAVRLDAGGIAITLEMAAPLDLVVVWTDPPRPMVCLEPWTAPRGALATGDRLLRLPPGESMELVCRYRVDAR